MGLDMSGGEGVMLNTVMEMVVLGREPDERPRRGIIEIMQACGRSEPYNLI